MNDDEPTAAAAFRCDPEPHHWVSSNVPGSDLVPGGLDYTTFGGRG